MPSPDNAFQVMWFAGIGIEFTLCLCIIFRRLVRAWPSLLTYSLSSLGVDLLLTCSRDGGWTHYNAYWIWIATSALLRVWVLADVVESFPGSVVLTARIRLAIFSMAGFTAFGACWIALRDVTTHHSALRSTAEIVNAALSSSWSAFLAVSLFGIWIVRIGWSKRGALVCAGVMIKVSGATFCSYLIATGSRETRLVAQLAASATALLAIISWTAAMMITEHTYQPALLQSNPVKVETSCTY